MASAVDLRPPAMISDAESSVAPPLSVVEKVEHRAENGDAEAQFTLALMYQHGVDVTADPVLARIWLEKAAARGHPRALERLAASATKDSTRPATATPIDAEAADPQPQAHIASDPPPAAGGEASGESDVVEPSRDRNSGLVPETRVTISEDRTGPRSAADRGTTDPQSEGHIGSHGTVAVKGQDWAERDSAETLEGRVLGKTGEAPVSVSETEEESRPAADSAAFPAPPAPRSEERLGAIEPQAIKAEASREPDREAVAKGPIPDRVPGPPITASGKEKGIEPTDPGKDAAIADPSSEDPRASSAPETPVVKPSPEPKAAASGATRISERARKPPVTSVKGLPIEGADWLRTRDEGSWTVQVGGAGNREKLTRWLRDLSLPGQVAIFENATRRSWYSAVYGSFPTRSEAERARRSLPDELQAHGPWTRSFREIQELLIDTVRSDRP